MGESPAERGEHSPTMAHTRDRSKTRAWTHTHTHAHTQTRTLARTHAHTHTHTKKVTDTDTYIQTRTHTETYTRIHTASQTQSHTQPLSHTRAHTHKHTQTHTRAHACIVSFTHADFCAAKRPMEPKTCRMGHASFVGACVVACRCGLHGRCGPAGSIFQNRALVGAPRRCMRCSARTGHPNRRRSGQFETRPTQVMLAYGIPLGFSPQRVGPTQTRSQARPGRETLANFCVCFFSS
jgi:hypothetical protein